MVVPDARIVWRSDRLDFDFDPPLDGAELVKLMVYSPLYAEAHSVLMERLKSSGCPEIAEVELREPTELPNDIEHGSPDLAEAAKHPKQ
jgi:hypothetical protein